jgi:hypothetical protein
VPPKRVAFFKPSKELLKLLGLDLVVEQSKVQS